jgi:hypothetical protein
LSNEGAIVRRNPLLAKIGLGGALAAMLWSVVAVAEPNPERNAYFGEEHIHTSWSVDAWVMGNRLTGPGEALKYAQGESIKHPMGFDIKIDTPLDFMGVTDHAEYVGVTKQADTPGSYVSKLPEAQPMIMKDPSSQEEQQKVFSYLLKLAASPPVKAFMDPKVTSSVWKENVKLADENNHPASSRRSARTSGRPCRGSATCTATSSSGTARRYRTIPLARSTPLAPRTCGIGWTGNGRRATSCSPSRTTPM